MKKLIKTNKGLFMLGVDDLIPMFDPMLKKFSHKCVTDLGVFEENPNVFDDYYQMGIMELMDVFKHYDYTKGATFFTLFHRELHNKIRMLAREFKADMRTTDQPLLYINKEVEGCEVENIVKGKDDGYFEGNGDGLENFLRANLSKEDRMLIAVHFKKNYNKAKGTRKKILFSAVDAFTEEGINPSISKMELAELLNVSRPTLNKRIVEAVEKMRELAEYYIHQNGIDFDI